MGRQITFQRLLIIFHQPQRQRLVYLLRDQRIERIFQTDIRFISYLVHKVLIQLSETDSRDPLVPGPPRDDGPVQGIIQRPRIGTDDLGRIPKSHIRQHHRGIGHHVAVMGIHGSRILQQSEKGLIIVRTRLFVTGHQRPHLEKDHPVVLIDGKFNIQRQSVHDLLQFPDCPQQFSPRRVQEVLIHVADHLHHPACRPAGHAVRRSGLIIVNQIVRPVILDIPCKDNSPVPHILCLALNQHLLILHLPDISGIRSNYRIYRPDNLLLT